MRLVIIFSLLSTGVFAQSIFASLQGTVTDPSGAALPKAKVTATNVNTGIASSVDANDAGFYFLGELRPGSYDI